MSGVGDRGDGRGVRREGRAEARGDASGRGVAFEGGKKGRRAGRARLDVCTVGQRAGSQWGQRSPSGGRRAVGTGRW